MEDVGWPLPVGVLVVEGGDDVVPFAEEAQLEPVVVVGSAAEAHLLFAEDEGVDRGALQGILRPPSLSHPGPGGHAGPPCAPRRPSLATRWTDDPCFVVAASDPA